MMNELEIYENGEIKLEGNLYTKAYPKNSVHEIRMVAYGGAMHIFLTDTDMGGLSAMNWTSEEYKDIQKILNIEDADIYYRTNKKDTFFNVSKTYRN